MSNFLSFLVPYKTHKLSYGDIQFYISLSQSLGRRELLSISGSQFKYFKKKNHGMTSYRNLTYISKYIKQICFKNGFLEETT